jgi:phosphatidylserine/phosphatidylglycerophosphate/cardiolipin synthase-like enzyme
MKSIALRIVALSILICGLGPAAYSVSGEPPLFFTPTAGHQKDVLAAINGARKSVHMTIFSLTDPAVIEALIAANDRGLDVKVILNHSTFERKSGTVDRLQEAGVEARDSSPGFSITHSKSFVVDGEKAYIMTLNLTKISDRVRDVALITSERASVDFVEELFATDWRNAAEGTDDTPTNIPENFVVSPVNSEAKLRALIQSARKSLKVVVENMSYVEIIQDLIDAHNRGVKVEVLMPRCNISNADFDMPAALQLFEGGIDVRLMPKPSTTDTPYIHQKSIVVDGEKAFLGSENFSFNSIKRARELGIIFDDARQVRQLSDVFDTDFIKALNYKKAAAASCAKKRAS